MRRPDPLVQWFAAASIAFMVLFNIALISLDVASIPIRGVLAVGLLALFGVLWPGELQRAISRHSLVMVLAGALAAIGAFASLVNGAQMQIVFRTILEVHIQAIVTLLFATMAAQLAGPRASVIAIVSATAVTVFIAALQFAGLEAAWSLRGMLGTIQDHALQDDSSFINRRPMGVSFSPIHLSTQASLAFTAYAGLRFWEGGRQSTPTGIDAKIIVALALLIAASIICATRSPILGAAIFLVLYMTRHGNALWVMLMLVAGLALYVASPAILEFMQGSEHRVLRVGDNSSSGRLTLATFGMLLFLDNPLGYGFDFVSQQHWGRYWQELYRLPSAGVVREAELHNYVINMLTTYGVGLLLVAPVIFTLLRRGQGYLLAFVPYIIHILFHNSGPFWNDTLIWFVIGALSAMPAASPARDTREPRLVRVGRTFVRS